MDRPIPFITLSQESLQKKKEGKEDGARRFVLHEDAAKIIEKISGKVTVITIAGLYRTGKSFILNRLAGSTIGFDIGSTIEPCTQGIWMWVVDPKRANNPYFPKDTTVILLDTEGLGSYTKSKTYDVQIFSIAVLLSSYFVYNSTGSIDETALDRLSLVVELTKHIKAQSDAEVEAPAELNAFFPKFMWLVRDFSLKLQSNGKDISAKEYLENSLAPLPGDPSKVKDKNLIRTSITQFFVDRSCFTLKRPVNDEKLLQHMEDAKEEDFRPQFLEELAAFMKHVFSSAKPKKLYSEPLNGPMFVHLCKNYLQAINEGSVPVIKTAWENVIEIENQKAVSEAFRTFEASFEEHFQNDRILEAEEFEEAYQKSVDKAMGVFVQMLKGDVRAPYEKKLMGKVEEVRKRRHQQNIQGSLKFCDGLLEEIVAALSKRLDEDGIHDIDALASLWQAQLENEYEKKAKGPKKDACLASALRKRPFEHSRRVMTKRVATLQQKHEEEMQQMKEEAAKDVGRIEKLYQSVLDSWDRTKKDLKEVEEENKQLIRTIAHLSEAL